MTPTPSNIAEAFAAWQDVERHEELQEVGRGRRWPEEAGCGQEIKGLKAAVGG